MAVQSRKMELNKGFYVDFYVDNLNVLMESGEMFNWFGFLSVSQSCSC